MQKDVKDWSLPCTQIFDMKNKTSKAWTKKRKEKSNLFSFSRKAHKSNLIEFDLRNEPLQMGFASVSYIPDLTDIEQLLITKQGAHRHTITVKEVMDILKEYYARN